MHVPAPLHLRQGGGWSQSEGWAKGWGTRLQLALARRATTTTTKHRPGEGGGWAGVPGRWRWTRGWRGRGWWEAAHDRHLILVDDGHRDVQLERVVLRVSRPAHKANVRHLHKLCRDRAVGLLRHRQHLLPVVQDELQQPPLEPGGLRGRPQLVIEELEPLVRKPVALQPRRDEALLAKRHVLMRPEVQPLHGAQRHLPAQVLDRQRPGYTPRWQVTHSAAPPPARRSRRASRLPELLGGGDARDTSV